MNPTRAIARRPLLSLVACCALLVSCADESPESGLDAAFAEALRLAQRDDAPVLAFVMPAAGVPADSVRVQATRAAEQRFGVLAQPDLDVPAMLTARDVLLRQVQLLRLAPPPFVTICGGHEPSAEPQMVFALTVPVVAGAATCRAQPGETVVLLTPMGERVQGFAIDLLDRDGFVASVGSLVLDEGVLAARRARVPEQVRADWQTLRSYRKATGRLAEVRERMHARLAPALPAVAPLMLRREEGRLLADGELWLWESPRHPLGTSMRRDAIGHAAVGTWLDVVLQVVDA